MKRELRELTAMITEAVVAATEQTREQHLRRFNGLFDEVDGVYHPRTLSVAIPGREGAEDSIVEVPTMSLTPLQSVQLERMVIDLTAVVDGEQDSEGGFVLKLGGEDHPVTSSSKVQLRIELTAETPPEALTRLNGKLVQGAM